MTSKRNMTVQQLKELCKQNRISGYSKMNKSQLIKHCTKNENISSNDVSDDNITHKIIEATKNYYAYVEKVEVTKIDSPPNDLRYNIYQVCIWLTHPQEFLSSETDSPYESVVGAKKEMDIKITNGGTRHYKNLFFVRETKSIGILQNRISACSDEIIKNMQDMERHLTALKLMVNKTK